MRLGLLLLLTMALGIVLGLLIGVQVFRVFQKGWKLSDYVKTLITFVKQIQLFQLAAAEAAAHTRHEKRC